MSKRFIDTELFDDPWFMDLSKDAKLLWIYLITKCNHAGLIDVNEKLCKFQTGLKNIQTVYKELGNRLVTVKEQLIFIPKYIEFQYPNFPNSKVKQQESAIKLLLKYNLFNEESLTLTKGLLNSYVYDSGNGNGNGRKSDVKLFYKLEKEKAEGKYRVKYLQFTDYIFGKNEVNEEFTKVLKLEKQLTFEQFCKLMDKIGVINNKKGEQKVKMKDLLMSMYTTPSYTKGRVTLYGILNNWINNAE